MSVPSSTLAINKQGVHIIYSGSFIKLPELVITQTQHVFQCYSQKMLNKFIKTLNFQIIFVIITQIHYTISDCGLPAIPKNAKVTSFE